MAKWIHKENVEVDAIYKRMDIAESYLIEFKVPVEKSMFPEEYRVLISDSNFLEEMKELVEGNKERCYFTYGMTDISFYKKGDNFALTHSPTAGYNVQLILAYGEMERIMNHLKHVSNLDA